MTGHLTGLANHGKDSLSASVKESKRNISDDSKLHIISFHVARRSTSSVRQAANLYGTNNVQISNSLSEVTKPEDRKMLSRSFGFNQKSIDFLNSPFFITVKDYLNLYNLMDWKTPQYGRHVAYGLAQEEFSNFRLRNSNTYHKIKVKVHVVKIIDDDVTSLMLFEKTFNKTSAGQEMGMVPIVYQINDRPAGNVYVKSILTYKGCSVNMAPNFKTQARVVKTFSKTLSPGDTFDFRMTHHLGPGIRLDVARTFMMTSRKGLQPSGYFPIIEVEGTPCEGQDLKTGSIYQGTCPGWYNYEYTMGIKAAKHNSMVSNNLLSQSYDDELEGSQITKEYAVKIYEREFIKTPPISYAADDIGEPGDKNKKFSIFSTSDERVVYSKSVFKSPQDKPYETTMRGFDDIDLDDNEIEDDEFNENEVDDTEEF